VGGALAAGGALGADAAWLPGIGEAPEPVTD
jgi:hypothetical protein